MADKKITALTDLSTGVAGADLLHVVDITAAQTSLAAGVECNLKE